MGAMCACDGGCLEGYDVFLLEMFREGGRMCRMAMCFLKQKRGDTRVAPLWPLFFFLSLSLSLSLSLAQSLVSPHSHQHDCPPTIGMVTLHAEFVSCRRCMHVVCLKCLDCTRDLR